jgi:antitoxin component HigA of HigAB toxin-antitoxin module
MSTDTTQERGLRRRLVTMALGLRPKDLRSVTTGNSVGALSVKISEILNGRRALPRDEVQKLGRLVSKRARRLFEG